MSKTVPYHGSFATLLCTTCQSSRLFPCSKVMKQTSPWWQEAGPGSAPMHDCAEPKIADYLQMRPRPFFLAPCSSYLRLPPAAPAFDTVERWLRAIVSTKNAVKYEHRVHQWGAWDTKTTEPVYAVPKITISLAFQNNQMHSDINFCCHFCWV